jgi:hypothetical protein
MKYTLSGFTREHCSKENTADRHRITGAYEVRGVRIGVALSQRNAPLR